MQVHHLWSAKSNRTVAKVGVVQQTGGDHDGKDSNVFKMIKMARAWYILGELLGNVLDAMTQDLATMIKVCLVLV